MYTNCKLPQAAYNNCSEVELARDSFDEEVADHDTKLGDYPYGTKVAKLFDQDWFEGCMLKYDEEEGFY